MSELELTRKTPRALVVSSYPDVCKSPTAPVPYQIVSVYQNACMVTPTVRATNQCVFTKQSYIQGVEGDEGGTGEGVVSGTHAGGGKTEPIEHSPTVRAEGQNVIRHKDEHEMNDKNTKGKAVFDEGTEPTNEVGEDGKPKSDPNPEPKPETPQEQAAAQPPEQPAQPQQPAQEPSSFARRPNESLAQYGMRQTWGRYQDFRAAYPRVAGGIDLAGAVGQGTVGVGLASTPTGVGQVAGGALIANAGDRGWAAVKQIWTGVPQRTYTSQAIGAGAEYLGASPEMGQKIGDGVQGAIGAVSGPGSWVKGPIKTLKQEGTQVIRKKAADAVAVPKPPPQPMSRGNFPDTW